MYTFGELYHSGVLTESCFDKVESAATINGKLGIPIPIKA